MDSLWRVQRELKRNGAAVGIARDVRAPAGNMANDVERVGGLLSDAEWAVVTRAAEEAPSVIVRNLVAAGEGWLREERRTRIANDHTMDEDQWLARSHGLIFEFTTADRKLVHVACRIWTFVSRRVSLASVTVLDSGLRRTNSRAAEPGDYAPR